MLETQDSNVASCGLYECCGFVLMDVDSGLCRALPGADDELTLIWYRLFERSAVARSRPQAQDLVRRALHRPGRPSPSDIDSLTAAHEQDPPP